MRATILAIASSASIFAVSQELRLSIPSSDINIKCSALASHDEYVLGGYRASGAIIAKISSNQLQWSIGIGNGLDQAFGYDQSNCLDITSNGKILSGGSIDGNAFLAVLGPSGDLEWSQRLSFPSSSIYDIEQHTDGSIYALGQSMSRYFLMKTDQYGSVQWCTMQSTGTAVDGKLIISPNGPIIIGNGGSDIQIWRFSFSGQMQSSVKIDSMTSDSSPSCSIDGIGNLSLSFCKQQSASSYRMIRLRLNPSLGLVSGSMFGYSCKRGSSTILPNGDLVFAGTTNSTHSPFVSRMSNQQAVSWISPIHGNGGFEAEPILDQGSIITIMNMNSGQESILSSFDSENGSHNGSICEVADPLAISNFSPSVVISPSSSPWFSAIPTLLSGIQPYPIQMLVQSCEQSVLPVELLWANVEPIDNTAKISWSTASETNSYMYLIQRSSNGMDFLTIEAIPASGNSQSTKLYEAIDNMPVQGLSYYRLIEVDTDGNESNLWTGALDIETSQRAYPVSMTGSLLPGLRAGMNLILDGFGAKKTVRLDRF